MKVKISPNQPTLIYIGVLILFLAAMWLTIEIGTDYLFAAPDLHGRWTLATDDETRAETFSIEQSGKYLQLTSSAGQTLDLVMTQTDADPDRRNITLAGGGWTVSTSQSATGGGLEFTFSPPAGEKSPSSGLCKQ